MKIEDTEAAIRLARAITADIQLYNSDTIKQGGDVSSEIDEGRQLFRSRVTASLHGIYEEAIRDAELQHAPTPFSAETSEPLVPPSLAAPAAPVARGRAPASGLPAGLFDDPAPPPRASGGSAMVVVMAVVVLVAAGSVAWFVM